MTTSIKSSVPGEQTVPPRTNKEQFIRLDAISFIENLGEDTEWSFDEITLGDINLLVGKNSSGKTRVLNVIAGLAKLLRGDLPKLFPSGNFNLQFSADAHKYKYELIISNNQVQYEKLSKDEKTLLDRAEKGIGRIWAEGIQQEIDFEAPQDQLAAKVRRDKIQHPFLEDLHSWASLSRHFQFGSPCGKDVLESANDFLMGKVQDASQVSESSHVVKLYVSAFSEFGDAFDQSILCDLVMLGYDCTEVGTEGVDHAVIPVHLPLLWLFVKERDLKSKTTQVNMSQGMFRALSLVIHLNYCIFKGIPRTMLIDDIGEGLDFSRAQAFISLLIERANANKLQIIMTTNDRFIMNGVPLCYWGIVQRNANKVHVLNERNSKDVFDDFSSLGLNNFEFFSTNFFEEGRVDS